jgi:hypothetical protein
MGLEVLRGELFSGEFDVLVVVLTPYLWQLRVGGLRDISRLHMLNDEHTARVWGMP